MKLKPVDLMSTLTEIVEIGFFKEVDCTRANNLSKQNAMWKVRR